MNILLAVVLVLALVFCFSMEALSVGIAQKIIPSETVFVMDGKTVTFDNAYEIDDSNYIQLRSVAKMLSGTKSQFNVYWDEELWQAVIETGLPYTGVKPAVVEPKIYGIGDKVLMKGTELTVTNTFTTDTAPGGFVPDPGETFYAVSFTVLTSNQPQQNQFWRPSDFISYISLVDGTKIYSFFHGPEIKIYPNQSTSVTIYFAINKINQVASVGIRDSQGTNNIVLVY